MPETDQQQLEADLATAKAEVARLQQDATVLNQANELLKAGLSRQLYAKMHTDMAELQGDISEDLLAANAEVTATEAQLAADVPPVVTPPVVTPPVVTPPSSNQPLAPVKVGSFIRDALVGTTLDSSLWGPPDYEPVNGVQTSPSNYQLTNPGILLKLPDANHGACISGKGKQYYDQSKGFYLETASTMQKSPNGGNANSHSNLWLSSDKWPASGEFDPFETLWNTVAGVGGARCTLHYGNNQAAAWNPPAGWGGRHVYGVMVLPDEIQLWADASGDGKTMVLMNTWTSKSGVSSALGPWYPIAQLGVSNSEDGNWWGQTVVPGDLPIEYLKAWNAAPDTERFGETGEIIHLTDAIPRSSLFAAA